MINLFDFRRLVAPIKRRLSLLVSRAILKAIKNTDSVQTMTLTLLNGETIEGVERYQEYGLETKPLADAEALPIFINGSRSLGMVLCVRDKRYRLKDLEDGEVALYTSEDATTPFRLHLKNGRIFLVHADTGDLTFDTKIDVKCSEINLGTGSLLQLIDQRFQALFNSHVHSGVVSGGATTGPPTVGITTVHMTTETKAA